MKVNNDITPHSGLSHDVEVVVEGLMNLQGHDSDCSVRLACMLSIQVRQAHLRLNVHSPLSMKSAGFRTQAVFRAHAGHADTWGVAHHERQ